MAIFAEMAVRPNVQEVANLMPDRTALPSGALAGTFNEQTVPTGVQVEALIDAVLDAVDPRVAAIAGDEDKRSVRTIVALEAAILTETTHFSDEGAPNTERIGVWERLIERHNAAILGAEPTAEDALGPQKLVAGSVVNGVIVVDQLIA